MWEKRNKCPLVLFFLSWLQRVFNNLLSCFQHLVLGYHSKCHHLKPALSNAILATGLPSLQPFFSPSPVSPASQVLVILRVKV